MKRYIFLLLAFFLSFSAHGFGVGMAPTITGTPMITNVEQMKRPVVNTSGRNMDEVGNVSESEKIQRTNNQANPNVVPNANKGVKTSSNNDVSCKTYEGSIYDRGQAGYSDCIRSIKNDRQGIKTIP